jgi:formylglycine-generating enzyme required for sulfatase activity
MSSKAKLLEASQPTIELLLDKWGFDRSSLASRKKKESEILSWLENFQSSEIEDALFILTKVQYKSEHIIRDGIARISLELERVLGDRLGDTYFYQLSSSPSGSGGMYLYDYRKNLSLSERHFPQNEPTAIQDRAQAMVFIDDMIGSGRQATKYYAQNLAEFDVEMYYCALFGFEQGIEHVRRHAGFKQIIVGTLLSDQERAFAPSSRVFEDKHTRRRLKRLCMTYGKKLYPKGPLGYDASESLLVFPHNTPNNTLPILWAGPNSEREAGIVWSAVWERKKLLGNPKTRSSALERSAEHKIGPVTDPTSLSTVSPAAKVGSTVTPKFVQSGRTIPRILQDSPTAPELVVVPAGAFNIGSEPTAAGRWSDSREGPRMLIDFVEPFAIGRLPVTRKQYRVYCEDTKRTSTGAVIKDSNGWTWSETASWLNPGFDQDDSHPVVCVSWNDAHDYVCWLSDHLGLEYRLPSEAEWEYSCRAGGASAFAWGDDISPADAAYNWKATFKNGYAAASSPSGTASAASANTNEWGIAGMHGNVWEWCRDVWRSSYSVPEGINVARLHSSDAQLRAVRGGSWEDDPRFLRSASRDFRPASYRSSTIGFRVLRVL